VYKSFLLSGQLIFGDRVDSQILVRGKLTGVWAKFAGLIAVLSLIEE
jgi:hypothetical protein